MYWFARCVSTTCAMIDAALHGQQRVMEKWIELMSEPFHYMGNTYNTSWIDEYDIKKNQLNCQSVCP